MGQLFGALFFGLLTGSLYALAALGISIVYRASRVLNFALPGIGTLSAYVGFQLLQSRTAYPLVALAVVTTAAITSAAVYAIYVRRLRNATDLAISVATLGILLVVQGLVISIWGHQPRALRTAVSGSVEVGTTTLNYADILALGVVAVCAGSLVYWTERTRSGASLRAASAGPLTSELLGINTNRNRLVAWSISGLLAGITGLFMIPNLYLDPDVYVNFVLIGFAAVVMGGFLSATGVLLSGLIIGIVISLLSTYVSGTLSATFTFLVIAVVLILRPQGLFGIIDTPVNEPKIKRRRLGRSRRRMHGVSVAARVSSGSIVIASPPREGRSLVTVRGAVVALGLVASLVTLGTLPFWVGLTMTSLLASAFAVYVSVEGVNILAGDGNRLSLGHGGLMAVGAYVAAYLSTNAGLPFILCLLLGTAAGAMSGAIIGVLTSRLEGVYLAVFTLAFGMAVPEIINTFSDISGGGSGLSFVVPDSLGPGQNQYWILLTVAVVVGVAVHRLRMSRIGRAWRAVRDTPSGASSVGYNVFAVRVGAFTLSAALAALGGVLSGATTAFVSPSTYGAFLSVYLVVAVVVGGLGNVLGSAVGALVITLLPFYAGSGSSPQMIYGLVLLFVIAVAPGGLSGAAMGVRDAARQSLGHVRRPYRSAPSVEGAQEAVFDGRDA